MEEIAFKIMFFPMQALWTGIFNFTRSIKTMYNQGLRKEYSSSGQKVRFVDIPNSFILILFDSMAMAFNKWILIQNRTYSSAISNCFLSKVCSPETLNFQRAGHPLRFIFKRSSTVPRTQYMPKTYILESLNNNNNKNV